MLIASASSTQSRLPTLTHTRGQFLKLWARVVPAATGFPVFNFRRQLLFLVILITIVALDQVFMFLFEDLGGGGSAYGVGALTQPDAECVRKS